MGHSVVIVCITSTGCVSENASSFTVLFLCSAVATYTWQHLNTWREIYSGPLRPIHGSDYGQNRLRKLVVRFRMYA